MQQQQQPQEDEITVDQWKVYDDVMRFLSFLDKKGLKLVLSADGGSPISNSSELVLEFSKMERKEFSSFLSNTNSVLAF